MQKNIKILFSSLLFMLILFLGSSSSIYAAEEGTMFSNAVNITFGKQYYKGWATRSDHLNHYCKIQVPQKGIVTINASKPFDSEGEYGKLELILYNSNNIPIWGSDTYYSVKGASDNYNFKVGLEAGTYYLTIRPTFYVKSGILSTSYCISYQKTDYCEVEPNEATATASPILLSQTYFGSFGADGSDYEDCDYYKVFLSAGNSYKISVGNFSQISPTTTIISLINPAGQSYALGYYLSDRVDIFNNNFDYYQAKYTGYHYIKIDNYLCAPYEYTLCVSPYEKKQQYIDGVKDSYTVTIGDGSINLNPTAIGTLSFKSSNSKVCSVYSDGEVYLRNCGKAVITIEATENDEYKKGTKNVTIIVIPNKPSINSITALRGKKLKITWDTDYDSDGYQIQIAQNKKFTKAKKTYKIKGKYTSQKTISKLKKNKKYYIRMRSYCKTGGKTYYSRWSKIKTKKAKE